MWGGEVAGVSPRELQRAIAQRTHRWTDRRQHDSSEFLMDLLDRLHEEINQRPVNHHTPVTPSVDVQGLNAASAAWKRHTSKHATVIVDLFHGM